MGTAALAVILAVAALAVFFYIPYSPTAARFERAVAAEREYPGELSGSFTEADIAALPAPVRRYIRQCGYLGTPKMASMSASLQRVDFVMPDRTLAIDYRQFNLAARPVRYALISSSLYGIPFEGLDALEGGRGRMRGTLAKVIPLFDQRGESMDRACLVTWLAECLLMPSGALQPFVRWEPVDDVRARATVTWEGVSAGGVFTFAETGELLEFRTGDRTAIGMDGSEVSADWSALFLRYRPVGGILLPEAIQSVWHYEEGDCVYFNRNEAPITVRYD